jgi:hypothetical protein
MSDVNDNYSWSHQDDLCTNNDIQHLVPDIEETKPVDQAAEVKDPKASATPKPLVTGSGLDSLGGGNII